MSTTEQSRELDPRVPYPQLEAAEEWAWEQFPQAAKIKAVWAPASEHGPVLVEVSDECRRTTVMAVPAAVWVLR